MTEEEAKTKWCPQARVATYATDGDQMMTAANKTSGGEIRTGARCIASACMAWRWSEAKRSEGFCGLAGAPQ